MRAGLPLASLLSCFVACSGSAGGPGEHAGFDAIANADGGAGIDGSDGGAGTDGAAAIDGSAKGSAAVRGTLGGQPFSVTGALALLTPPYGPGFPDVVVLPVNYDLTCDLEHQSRANNTVTQHANATELEVLLNATGHPVAPGTYTSAAAAAGGAAALTAAANYYQADSNCQLVNTETTTNATVTISAIDMTAISGSFDLTFQNGDHVTGHFSAPVCVVEPPGDITNLGAVCLP